ncbi:uncharacterized protein LOC126784652 [Argentina anserina]|uniref:uncharacterized protein LOC126784652 n=1 Tax=Argentina anserina TaxID=57926 RepID=UPI002176679C|nr:uncharacterized protein LOC126784652 [Potentilla anserina]
MAASVDTPSPLQLNKDSSHFFSASDSSPHFTPSSDKRFWSSLQTRIDLILQDRNSRVPMAENLPIADPSLQMNAGEAKRGRGLKEDSMILMRGFDSIAHTLSQLSNTLDNALQGANDLAKPPTLTEIFHSQLSSSDRKEDGSEEQEHKVKEAHVGLKRKFDNSDCLEEQGDGDDEEQGNEQGPKDGKLKKAKNLAISMATKAASFARQLKLIRSDLSFMQERCALLEEENRRFRDGFDRGLRPEEDDLVRLQLEALLAEKSRLANENANLVRENQCLHQLVEYHQLTSQDMSASSYEQVIQGLCLDFSSPPPPIPEEEAAYDEESVESENGATIPRNDLFGLHSSFDEQY